MTYAADSIKTNMQLVRKENLSLGSIKDNLTLKLIVAIFTHLHRGQIDIRSHFALFNAAVAHFALHAQFTMYWM